MNRSSVIFAIALLGGVGAALAQAPTETNPIKSVWLVKQHSCKDFVAMESVRSPDAAEISRTRVVKIPNMEMEFRIPSAPEIPVTSVRLVLNDRGRKVVDHYILMSENELNNPSAAVMVTELPPAFDSPERALRAAVAGEQANLEGTVARPTLERISTVWGQGLDLFVPGRTGSPCFPAARYQLTPSPDEKPAIGLSRFVTVPGRLIQFALLLNVAPGTPIDEQKANVRRVMDLFASGLRKP